MWSSKSNLLVCVIATCLAACFSLDVKLSGINYNSRIGPDWAPVSEKCKSAEAILKDMKTLHTVTDRVRIYSLVDCNQGEMVLNAVKAVNEESNAKSPLKVWLGIWVSNDQEIFDRERKQLASLIDRKLVSKESVVGIHVGSETVYRKEITATQAIAYMNSVKTLLNEKSIDIPISIADIMDTFLAYPKLIEAVDVVSANSFPFWTKTKIENAGDSFFKSMQQLIETAKKYNKKVIVSETGWSSGSEHVNASVASPENQVSYFKQFYALAKKMDLQYFYFSSFDDAWKAKQEKKDTVEAHFGIFDSTGIMKPGFQKLVLNDSSSSDGGNSADGSKSTDEASNEGSDNGEGNKKYGSKQTDDKETETHGKKNKCN